MNLTDAAKGLYNEVKMPAGTYNVIPFHTFLDDYLEVWVDEAYLGSAHKIPVTYEGFPVVVKEMPKVRATN